MEATPQEVGEPRFDVRARRAPDCPLEGLQQRLVDLARLPPAKAQSLVEALQAAPTVVLGRSVSRERAAKAQLLSRAGLHIEITPVLQLAPKPVSDVDGRVECPACGEIMVPGPHRQCAHCGVYIDKVSPEVLMRRKLRKQEQARVQLRLAAEQQQSRQRAEAEMEQRLRQEIREQLESRHGLAGPGRALPAWQRPAILGGGVVLAGAAFAAGWFLPHGAPLDAVPVATATAGTAGVPPGEQIERLLAHVDRGEQAPGAGRRPAPPIWTVEPADSLRPGPDVPPQSPEQLLATSFGRVEGLPPLGAGLAWPVDLLPGLRADLAVALAESGQMGRAEELLQSLEPWRASVDPRLTEQLRRARLLVHAWGLYDHGLTTVQPLLTRLSEGLRSMVDPIERASLLAQVVPVMARAPAVSDEVITGLIRQTGAAVKAVAEPGPRHRLTEAWIVAEAQVLLARAEHEAVSGHFSRLRARIAALAALQPQTIEPATQARLLARQVRISQLAGESTERLVMAWLQAVERVPTMAEQADLLREAVEQPGGALLDDARRLAGRLATRGEAAGQGAARAEGLGRLSLLWAELGDADQASLWRQRALQTPGLQPETALRLRAQLTTEAEIGLAQATQRLGELARAESHWRRVATYVL
ncbi:hypothetical protein KAK06_20080 [Ideonella sp. 4Y11]|uniref:Uncharacterized protein n=1 Tax=Ideonella aquatica TaxID=2824119 RepID=A0A940YNR9_9BURK|nr:hypothetical protein [Ideonella aquatica]MBQ0961266.1 hypothetical protein [Ideonella aquatica]